jgi:hypothetical protein
MSMYIKYYLLTDGHERPHMLPIIPNIIQKYFQEPGPCVSSFNFVYSICYRVNVIVCILSNCWMQLTTPLPLHKTYIYAYHWPTGSQETFLADRQQNIHPLKEHSIPLNER